MERNNKIALAAGGIAAAAVLLYLFKARKHAGSFEDASKEGKKKEKAVESEDAAKEKLKDILKEMSKSHEQMKAFIKDLTQELRAKPMSLVDTCARVRQVQPEDPLERHGLKMMDFDKLLERHQQDNEVRDAIAKIMSAPTPNSTASERIQAISVKDVIDVHKFMLQELEALIEEYNRLPDTKDLDARTVTIAAQAIVGARFEEEFNITSEDIESAVLTYHANLATDQDFAQVNIKIQHAMSRLLGTPFTPS
mmetsp:Transcript_84698/g.203060  ORF Transcript_84698/g.203060 Transcript_84698/m.203060 type:complete len:252 (+) Transcript_84698:71-826(+)